MNQEDYKGKLGIKQSDKEKQVAFCKRIKTYFEYHILSVQQYRTYCYRTGCEFREKPGLYPIDKFNYPVNYFLWDGNFLFEEILYRLSNLINVLEEDGRQNKKEIIEVIQQTARMSGVKIELIKDEDGVFFIPSGIEMFDDALIHDTLDWLNEYPDAKKVFSTALQQYGEGKYDRNVGDNMRLSLELFLKKILGNSKSIEKNIDELGRFLDKNGIEPIFVAMFKRIIDAYAEVNNEIFKHNDKAIRLVLEYIIYQTGVLMRFLISVKRAD